MTMAPAALNRSNSACTSLVTMFQMIRPGWAFLPETSECGPTVILPDPIIQPV